MSLYRELAVSLILVSAAHLLPTTLPISPPLDWGCPPCNRSSCPAASCDEDLQYVDACGCCVLCARLEGELCGGEGNTGGSCNGSGLFCAYRPGRIFGESRMGVCENERCQRQSCGYRQRCKVVVRGDGVVMKPCKCDYFRCGHKWNPLCSRDGRTYTSVCKLQKAECLAGEPIGIGHFLQCEDQWNPLCGRDRKTYTSTCELAKAECLAGRPIGIRHFNECVKADKDIFTPRKENTVLSPRPDHPDVQCMYSSKSYDPHDIVPPTSRDLCTYHVCSAYGQMVKYPVPGCEGNPPEIDWHADEVVTPAQWSEWSPYSECVGNCREGGYKNRTRTCTDPPPSNHTEAAPGAVQCEGDDLDNTLCEPDGCQICNYTDWSPWSMCSTSELCETGIRTRQRNVTNNPTVPQLCITTDTKVCQLLNCTKSCRSVRSDGFKLVNKRNGCHNTEKLRMYMCGGTCDEGKCCRGVYPSNPDEISRIPIDMVCPNSSTRKSYWFGIPYWCECRDCREPYQVLALLRNPWKIIY